MRPTAASAPRAGMTIVEIAVVVGLLGVVLASVNSVLQALAGSYRSGTARMEVDAVGSRAMRRVNEAFRTAQLESIAGLPEAPLYTTGFQYRRSLGYGDGQTIWSPLEHLQYSPVEGTLEWIREPEVVDLKGKAVAKPKILFACDRVAPLLAGEVANGLDDNGNGLIDEPGFCATREGNLLSVWLTLLDEDHMGRPVERTWSTSVRCRN